MQGQHENSARVGVSVLVKNGDRILLEKRKNSHGAGTWGPPGGYIKYGETLEEAAARETREETGVEISDIKFRVITNDVFEAEQQQFITVWVEAFYVSGDLKVNAPGEESEIGWFQWASLPEPLFLPLTHLLDGQTYPSQTTQDKIGSAIETKDVLPHSEALSSDGPQTMIVPDNPTGVATGEQNTPLVNADNKVL